MFGKKQAASAVTVIAAGSVIEGTLRVRGMLQVDGTIEGTLIAEGHVSVGPEGRISGDLTTDSLSVGGKVEGTIRARGHLHVLNSGTVRGETRYSTLEVDRGGVMDGRAARDDAPANTNGDKAADSIETAAAE
jgi:cytoskeletal protein CcmA (bactofilin family)